jgi:hypothetical protein
MDAESVPHLHSHTYARLRSELSSGSVWSVSDGFILFYFILFSFYLHTKPATCDTSSLKLSQVLASCT